MYNPYGIYYPFNGCCNPTYSGFCQDYWERSLFQRLRTLFKFEGLPKGGPGQVKWDKDAFLYGLFRIGFLVVFESKTYGVVPQPGTPTGMGLQFQPTGMQISTPYFNFLRPLQIGTECYPIKLTPDYMGVWDIVLKYATELKMMDIAIRQSQINARFTYAFMAEDDNSAQSVKALMEKVENADPAVVVNKKMFRSPINKEELRLPWFQFDRDLKKNFILLELLEARRTCLTSFYHEIGVRTLPDKKERYISSEVGTYDSETYNRREVWNISLQESLETINKMYGLHITVEYVEPKEEEVRHDAGKSAD